jgi:hypothetical protein
MLAAMICSAVTIRVFPLTPIMAVASISVLLVASGCAHHPDNEVRAAFARELSSRPSATESLRQWCETRGIARPAQIRARRIAGFRAPPAELFDRLRVPADTTLARLIHRAL